ncbi:MAG: tRNA uridine-5-carboxymethylaminomethyl(34) synthesis GTPase MnmE [candidate division WOR-3 bacterium]
MINWNDTIAAIATPPGIGGIAVIRLSGNSALTIADKIFVGKRPTQCPTHTIHYGKIINPKNQMIIDTVLLSVFRKPKSYTGEDMVEISCHGGTFVADTILKILLEQGARLAQPGEFTKRAVLSGRMDIVQAEAILDLVNAKTETARRSALSQLVGTLSKVIEEIGNELKDILCLTENALEFEENERINPIKKIHRALKKVENKIGRFISKGESERFLREGALVVIVGKPNVGKSSIFNCLLERERALVTEIPGTTRDSLEERTIIGDTLIRLVDTAGIRQTKGKVEALGVVKTYDYLKAADSVLAIFDNSKPPTYEDKMVLEAIKEKRCLFVLNKIDLKSKFSFTNLPGINGQKVIRTSARYNQGISELKKALAKLFQAKNDSEYFITNRRHIEALRQAQNALVRAQKENYLETIALEIRIALDALGEITGKVTNEEILNQIFAQFCIGK